MGTDSGSLIVNLESSLEQSVRFIQRGPVHFEGDISWGLSSRFKSLGTQAHLLKAQGSPYHTLSRMLPAQSLWGQIPGP